MFEPTTGDEEKWWSNPAPLEGSISVQGFYDSMPRFVVDPSGMNMQLLNIEPLGHPRLTLHQNHYSTSTTPGTQLGSVDYGSRDDMSATMYAFTDGVWTSSSHPTGLSFRVTPPDSLAPRFPSMTMRADGRVAFGGGPASFGNSMVSMGCYRRGIFELPSVDKYCDLLAGGDSNQAESFVNGAIVYAKDLDKVLISQGGTWQAIATTPISKPYEVRKSQPIRQMGEPRKDGRPPIFGPRMPAL